MKYVITKKILAKGGGGVPLGPSLRFVPESNTNIYSNLYRLYSLSLFHLYNITLLTNPNTSKKPKKLFEIESHKPLLCLGSL